MRVVSAVMRSESCPAFVLAESMRFLRDGSAPARLTPSATRMAAAQARPRRDVFAAFMLSSPAGLADGLALRSRYTGAVAGDSPQRLPSAAFGSPAPGLRCLGFGSIEPGTVANARIAAWRTSRPRRRLLPTAMNRAARRPRGGPAARDRP